MSTTSFRTTDVDEANDMTRQVFCESHLEPVRNARRFRFDMVFDTAGPMTLGILSHGCEITGRVGGIDMTYSLGIALKGAFPMQVGHEDVTADSFTAAVATPTSKVRYRGSQTGTERLFVLSFDKEELEHQLRSMLARDRIGTIDLAPSLDLRNGLGAQWWRMTSMVVLGLQSPGGLATNPMMTSSLSSAIMSGLLLASGHRYRDDLDAQRQPVPPAVIRKATEIIERRAHEPLTVPQIAAEIGCSLRALQDGYRKHLNMTPREHIGRVRMDRAHALLRSAAPDATTVAEIAARCGFNQPGRFATDYRKIYGVPPSTTLRED